VERLSFAPGNANEHRRPIGGVLAQVLDGRTAGGDEGWSQDQILRRIAGNIEFGVEDEIGARFPCRRIGFAGLGEIGGDRANGRIELRESNDEMVGHGPPLSPDGPFHQLI
jgi:hypothetical protein